MREQGPTPEEIGEINKPESNELNPQNAIVQEKSIFERFTGLPKEVAKVLILVSALSAAPALASERSPEHGKQTTASETGEKKSGGEINEANLTSSSLWSQEIMNSARADLSKIKTAEDAKWFMKSRFKQLVSEFDFPTQGNIKEGVYGVKTREYSEDDLKLLLKNATEMKQLLQDLHARFGIENFDKYLERIDRMISETERRSSYSSQRQNDIFDRYDEYKANR